MAARIIIEPVIVSGNSRMPKSGTMTDPGRPPSEFIDDDGVPQSMPKTYGHTSAISDGLPGQRNSHCVSFVVGVDMTPLDNDPQTIKLFEDADPMLSGMRARLQQTPRLLGWNPAKQQRVRDRLVAQNVDVTGINADTPLWQIVNRICQVFSPGYDIRQAWTVVPGA